MSDNSTDKLEVLLKNLFSNKERARLKSFTLDWKLMESDPSNAVVVPFVTAEFYQVMEDV